MLALAKDIQRSIPEIFVQTQFTVEPENQRIVPHDLVSNSRGYIERVVVQINGCYEKGWFDACAVMMRRLLETLIIECFEAKKLDHIIKQSNGDFLMLNELINKTVSQKQWNLGRNSKNALTKFKKLGDLSAHGRRFNTRGEDIKSLIFEFRVLCEELLCLSDIRKVS